MSLYRCITLIIISKKRKIKENIKNINVNINGITDCYLLVPLNFTSERNRKNASPCAYKLCTIFRPSKRSTTDRKKCLFYSLNADTENITMRQMLPAWLQQTHLNLQYIHNTNEKNNVFKYYNMILYITTDISHIARKLFDRSKLIFD